MIASHVITPKEQSNPLMGLHLARKTVMPGRYTVLTCPSVQLQGATAVLHNTLTKDRRLLGKETGFNPSTETNAEGQTSRIHESSSARDPRQLKGGA